MGEKLLPAALDLRAPSPKHVEDLDRAGERLVEHVLQVEALRDRDAHDFRDVGDDHLGESALLENVQNPASTFGTSCR
jgi:hypothetical protein